MRVKGDALTERGIQHGDILIADAAASPSAGNVVIAMIYGDVLVCQLAYQRGQWWLRPSSPGHNVGARVQAELRGVSCLPLSLMAATRKGIAVTWAFGHAIITWGDLREAVAAYATRAGEKLRSEGLQATHMAVFLQTNPHKRDEPWHSEQRGARIDAP